ncbi:hypothetical protein ISS85_03405 [Candidatus Microgenomates bacterium]|nr:hypothetical protein [Candidatus Microgenomates bacterium]
MDNLLRTTITLPENLLRLAKVVSAQEDKTLSQLIREALEKAFLAQKEKLEWEYLDTLEAIKVYEKEKKGNQLKKLTNLKALLKK